MGPARTTDERSPVTSVVAAHGRLFAVSDPGPNRLDSYWGASLEEAYGGLTADDLHALPPAAEIELGRFNGNPLVVASASQGRVTYALDAGSFVEQAPTTAQILVALERAWPGRAALSSGPIGPNDLYGELLEGPLPASAVRFEMDDRAGTWVHVDHETGQILEVMNRSRRAYRWLYNGLHSFDLPWLAERSTLRKAVMLPLLLGGFLLSITSVSIAARRIKVALSLSRKRVDQALS
jgi:hypothetical protein